MGLHDDISIFKFKYIICHVIFNWKNKISLYWFDDIKSRNNKVDLFSEREEKGKLKSDKSFFSVG